MLIHQVLTAAGLDDDQADLYRSLVLARREPVERIAVLAKLPDDRAASALATLLRLGLLDETLTEDGRRAVTCSGIDALERRLMASGAALAAGTVEWVLGKLRLYRERLDVLSATIIMPADRHATWKARTDVPRAVHALMPALDLRIGTVCNFNCLYCLVGHEKKGLRSPADLERELRLGRRRNLARVNLTGGEPTLHPRIFDVIATARGLGYTGVTLVSNAATLAYPERLQRFLDAGVDRFGFSLDTVDAGVADTLVQRPGTLPAVLRGIENVLDAASAEPRLRVYAICVVTLANLCGLRDTVSWLAERARARGVELLLSLDFVIAEENAWVHRERILPRASDAAPLVADAVRVGRAAGLVMTHRNLPPCVLPDDVRDACLDDHLRIGRVFDVPGEAAYEDEAIDFYRVKRPSCRGCRFFRTCWGVHMSYVHVHGFEEFEAVP
jgi:MoaA/NifB/PqqE/SkfB family radical SAM enzyme